MSNLFRNISVRNRFIIVFGLIVLLNLTSLFITFKDLGTMRSISDELYNLHFMGMNRLIESDRDAYQSRLAISESFSATNRSNSASVGKLTEEIISNLEQIDTRYSNFLELYKQAVNDSHEDINNTVRDNYNKLKSITGNLVNMLKSNQYDEAEVVYFSEYIPVLIQCVRQ
ncbi:MAG: hypothetical protein HC830_03535 [Bacteroidetes bacterium]|nr:hypothetical protein [Bacteroidota bacterium]